MEYMLGRQRRVMGQADLATRAAAYPYRWIDLGTGDGRYVQHIAATLPRWLIVGVDACREPLRERSRAGAANTLYVIANALDLPRELDGLANRVSINFPWGSLLEGLVEGDRRLLEGLGRISQPEALLELRLNGGALSDLGLSADEGAARVRALLATTGWRCAAAERVEAPLLRSLATTWARRLAHGPHPWAITLRGVRDAGRR